MHGEGKETSGKVSLNNGKEHNHGVKHCNVHILLLFNCPNLTFLYSCIIVFYDSSDLILISVGDLSKEKVAIHLNSVLHVKVTRISSA